MKNLICVVVLLIASNSYAQEQKKAVRKVCNFLGPLQFKNGMATVVVKAVYNDFFRSPDEPLFQELTKQKKLLHKDYFSSCCGGSSIGFTPEKCSAEYSGTIRKGINPGPIKFGQTVYLTCLVFEGQYDSGVPFFLINNISYEKGYIARKEDIKPLEYIKPECMGNDSGNAAYFGDDADALIRHLKCVLVITTHYLAYIQTADNKIICFSYEKRVQNEHGYLDIYRNGNSFFELNINQVIQGLGNFTYRNGRLTIVINNIKTSFDVYGEDKETDSYNERN